MCWGAKRTAVKTQNVDSRRCAGLADVKSVVRQRRKNVQKSVFCFLRMCIFRVILNSKSTKKTLYMQYRYIYIIYVYI